MSRLRTIVVVVTYIQASKSKTTKGDGTFLRSLKERLRHAL